MVIELNEKQVNDIQEALYRAATVECQKGDDEAAGLYWDIIKTLYEQMEMDDLSDCTEVSYYKSAIHTYVDALKDLLGIKSVYGMARAFWKEEIGKSDASV